MIVVVHVFIVLQIQQMTEENTESIEEILKAKSKDLLKI